jgi:hypothetical protein
VKKLRILIADDHAPVRRGARGILHTRRGWSGLTPLGPTSGKDHALCKSRARSLHNFDELSTYSLLALLLSPLPPSPQPQRLSPACPS